VLVGLGLGLVPDGRAGDHRGDDQGGGLQRLP
jgi:hypothetical protein